MGDLIDAGVEIKPRVMLRINTHNTEQGGQHNARKKVVVMQ